jgi:hypothetical protein
LVHRDAIVSALQCSTSPKYVCITFYQRTLLGTSANQKRHYLTSYNKCICKFDLMSYNKTVNDFQFRWIQGLINTCIHLIESHQLYNIIFSISIYVCSINQYFTTPYFEFITFLISMIWLINYCFTTSEQYFSYI